MIVFFFRTNKVIFGPGLVATTGTHTFTRPGSHLMTLYYHR